VTEPLSGSNHAEPGAPADERAERPPSSTSTAPGSWSANGTPPAAHAAPTEPPTDLQAPASAGIDPAPAVLGPTGRALPDLTPPPRPDRSGPATVIALCNQKGGVGKTTTAINLGAALAELGRRVLLLDFDPQGSLAVGLGINPHELDQSVYNVLMDRDTSIADVLVDTGVEGMDLVPSNIDLSAAEVALVGEVAREMTLARELAKVRHDYDYVLIDCQPSLGLLTVNALTAADAVLIPLECEFFALRGVAMLMDTIEKVQDRLNPRLAIVGIVATMFDARTLHGREVLERVVQAFGDRVFHTVIARTVRFPDATVAGEPITTFSPASNGATSYRSLAVEVLQRMEQPGGAAAGMPVAAGQRTVQ
jgi:chromosome partitioning protein